MRGWVMAAASVVASALYVVQAAPQQTQPRPGPGSGVMTVTGQVAVSSLPPVEQRTDWRVAVVNDAAVHVTSAAPFVAAAPSFLEQGATYLITWPDGASQRIVAGQLGGGAWVLAGGSGEGSWVNLAVARSVQRVR